MGAMYVIINLTMHCRHCSSSLLRRKQEYCSNRCQMAFKRDSYISRWLRGEENGRNLSYGVHGSVRRYLLDKHECACSECGWNKRHPIDGRPLVQIDHKDGDPLNCSFENLRVLCPNCHSMTDTYGARNKGNPALFKRGRVRYKYTAPLGV